MSRNEVLSIKSLTKSYGDRILFKDFSYDFEFGKIYALVGGNGTGKTTLFKIMLGLASADAGEISFDGKSFFTEECAVAFQEHRLFGHLSAQKNISLIGGDENEAKELLYYFGFSEEDMRKKPKALSGGMKQAVSISRAVASKRKILLLDEASKELDREVKDKFYSLLSKIKKDKIIIMITHDADDIAFCDEALSVEAKHKTV